MTLDIDTHICGWGLLPVPYVNGYEHQRLTLNLVSSLDLAQLALLGPEVTPVEGFLKVRDHQGVLATPELTRALLLGVLALTLVELKPVDRGLDDALYEGTILRLTIFTPTERSVLPHDRDPDAIRLTASRIASVVELLPTLDEFEDHRLSRC